jgi:hypothetical protein
MATYWHEDGVLLIVPMSATRFRLIADLGFSKGGSPASPTLDRVQAIMDNRGPRGMVTSDPVWLSGLDDVDAVGDYLESIDVRASVVDALEAVARGPATASRKLASPGC